MGKVRKTLAALLTASTVAMAIPAAPAAADDSFYDVTFTNNVKNANIVGLGWNSFEITGHLNKSSYIENAAGRTFTEADWDKYFGLLQWSGSNLTRLGFWVRMNEDETNYEPVNDNDDPYVVNESAFQFDTKLFNRYYKFLQELKERDMDVWFTHWKNHALWNASGTSTVWDEDREQQHPISDDEYAEGAVYLLKYLKTTKQFTNIKYFSMWNEPNGSWAYGGSYPTQWWPLTQAFHNQISAQGVSNNVYLIAPDSSNGYTTIVPQLGTYGSYVDVFSDHDYTSKSALFNGSLRNYQSTIDSINSFYGKDTPFLIGEFGNSGNGSGTVTGDNNVYNGSLSLAQMVIHNFNNGVKGMLRWQFSPNATSSENNNYTAVTINDPDYSFKPYSPVYYPHAVQVRYVRKGMNVYEQTGESGGLDANGKRRVRSAYLKDSTDNTTILIANDSSAAKNVTFHFDSGLYTPASFHQLYVNGANSGMIQGSDISVTGGQATFTLNGNTIMALTTLDPGTMTDPVNLYSFLLRPHRL